MRLQTGSLGFPVTWNQANGIERLVNSGVPRNWMAALCSSKYKRREVRENNMMSTPGICRLEPLVESDSRRLADLFTCPITREFLGGPVSAQLAVGRSRNWISCSSTEPIWAMRSNENSELLGYVLLSEHHDGNDTEISYALHPAHWGRGYATEALKLGAHHAFSKLGLPRILAETQAKNLRSIKLLKRIGMIEDRRLFRHGEEQIVFRLENPSLE